MAKGFKTPFEYSLYKKSVGMSIKKGQVGKEMF